ncbi:MAG: MBL fold metallo-hydrolase [Acidimicrobiia bacterium]|nr:MBL fold metallo-hydrolase [Acidimicrobiia bacterium]
MGLTLTVLGCSGTYAAPGNACSGYLVSDGSTTVWIDAGSGTLANLQRHVALDGVDALVLSHEHPDHWTDLEGFFNVCRFVTGRKGIPVFAPPGLKRRTYNADESPYFDWRAVKDGGSAAVGGLALSFSRTDHGPETLAMRVDGGGRSLGYSADTGPAWSLEELGSGLDLALCEATFLREQEGTAQHLSARQAGASARAAGAGRLVLTHIWPTVDSDLSRAEAADAYGDPVEVAVMNETYLI